MLPDTLLISELLAGYRARSFTPRQLFEAVLTRNAGMSSHNAWIYRFKPEQVLAKAQALDSQDPASLPLYGIPFAIKDNIDLADVPTTAGCPDYAYTPGESAAVVSRLIAAGAIPLGKTNLDQFATGLVGVRSPYGACHNSFQNAYIAGGSSAGSAVAVALGQVSFALGTDTAGSGRVPAAFNNLIGLKPSLGALSTRGIVPACRSLDCVCVFALSAEDAARIHDVAAVFDPGDAYSRPWQSTPLREPIRYGVPRADQLEFFGDAGYADLFAQLPGRLRSLGGEVVEVDIAPFLAVAKLLHEGPWVAERYSAVGDFLESNPWSAHPVTRQIIAAGRTLTAADTFRAQHRLMALKRATEPAWETIDVLVTPTTGTIYPIDAVEQNPVRLNSNLGHYTSFVNLLDLAAVAVPAGLRKDGLPFGVTLVAPRGTDTALLKLAGRLHRNAVPSHTGALEIPLLPQEWPLAEKDTGILIAVCGAHMEGLPLNSELTRRGARLKERTRTAPAYHLYALPGGPPHRPGLVKAKAGGAAIEVEIWSVPAAHLGSFLADIPAPLGIGKVEIEGGREVSGLLCEEQAIADALDITELGGWRRYLQTEK